MLVICEGGLPPLPGLSPSAIIICYLYMDISSSQIAHIFTYGWSDHTHGVEESAQDSMIIVLGDLILKGDVDRIMGKQYSFFFVHGDVKIFERYIHSSSAT